MYISAFLIMSTLSNSPSTSTSMDTTTVDTTSPHYYGSGQNTQGGQAGGGFNVIPYLTASTGSAPPSTAGYSYSTPYTQSTTESPTVSNTVSTEAFAGFVPASTFNSTVTDTQTVSQRHVDRVQQQIVLVQQALEAAKAQQSQNNQNQNQTISVSLPSMVCSEVLSGLVKAGYGYQCSYTNLNGNETCTLNCYPSGASPSENSLSSLSSIFLDTPTTTLTTRRHGRRRQNKASSSVPPASDAHSATLTETPVSTQDQSAQSAQSTQSASDLTHNQRSCRQHTHNCDRLYYDYLNAQPWFFPLMSWSDPWTGRTFRY